MDNDLPTDKHCNMFKMFQEYSPEALLLSRIPVDQSALLLMYSYPEQNTVFWCVVRDTKRKGLKLLFNESLLRNNEVKKLQQVKTAYMGSQHA